MANQIWFDMDGTIANLYGVEGWLDMLIKQDTTPYAVAKPLINMQVLAKELNKLINKGYEVGVISWLSKNGTKEYNEKVAQVKIAWLKKHLASVKFTHIDIVPYGTPKQINRSGILFDDELHNRETWLGEAHNVNNIIEVLRGLE